jgi:monoamine oxidase
MSRSTMSQDFDVIVIGAGAAGLAASDVLSRAGRSVVVLEARDRVGGRCWSLSEPGLPVPIELGAEFIHGRSPATFSLLERAGAAAVDRTGEGWYIERGKFKPMGKIFAGVRNAIRKAGPPRKDISFETYLRRDLRHVPEQLRSFARRRVEGYEGADPTRASARTMIEEWASEDEATGQSHYRPLGGYGPLLDWLAGSLDRDRVSLQLRTIVRAVHWRRGRVEIDAVAGGEPVRVRARHGVITLPLGILQQPRNAPDGVRFSPPLNAKRVALRGLAPSQVVKVALRFRSAFWEKSGGGRHADAAFLRVLGAPFPSFWTALPVHVPLLIGWAGGPNASRLTGAGAPAIIRRAEASLKIAFGRRAQRSEAAYVHDWQRDPFAKGAYSYVTVGGAGARKALAEPLAGTLYFAGEAADFEGENGTVAGALQSGRRAALRILGRDR